MAEDKVMPKEDGPRSPWVNLLETTAKQLVPVLLTAGSLIGFVAFAGAVIVWTRFSAAEVPADQAVNAVPRDELVAIGSSLLLLFGFFGALAVIAVFLIDRGGRVTPGMSRGLLLLLIVEGASAIVLVEGEVWQHTAVAIELFVIPMGVVLWSTFSGFFTRLDKSSLPDREGDERDAVLEAGPFRTGDDKDPLSQGSYLSGLGAALVFSLCAALISDAFGVSPLDVLMVSIAALALALALAVSCRLVCFYRDPAGDREAVESLEKRGVEADELAEEMALIGPALKLRDEDEDPRKPPRFELKIRGIAFVTLMLSLSVLGPYLALGKLWLIASLGSAIVLGAGLWRIASLAAPRFMWYGLAVFISVPLFGTLTAMARNIEDPQVQPMALIRNTDGPDEAIQGLYVTEADERIYFATVAIEGCTNELTPHSGRLLWVPKSEVVAMSVGPPQNVDDAANAALEMAYALTPGAGAPGGGRANLTAAEIPTADPGAEGTDPMLDKRLEGVGAAVRPNFGTGLSLVPEDAPPGGVVTLRMSLPNPNGGVGGFGRTREGRTLRLGGAPAPIIREKAHSAVEAEYAKTSDGKVLPLDKEGVYGKGENEGRFYPLKNPMTYGDPRFVRLSDSSGAEAQGALKAPTGSYLELAPKRKEAREGEAELLEGQKVTLKSGDEPELRTNLLSQAWHENHIKFRVPDKASSGVVSVECKQLAGQPLLRVTRPPTARIAVRMQTGTGRIRFDGRRSSDEDGKVKSRRWLVDGLPHGGRKRISVNLPPRLAPYRVRLMVTDSEGETDTTELSLLRLPASLFEFDKAKPKYPAFVRRIHHSLIRAAERERPAEIDIDGYADDVGPRSRNMELSLRRAEAVRKELLARVPSAHESPDSGGTSLENQPSSSKKVFASGGQVPVKVRAFGESCPVDPRGGRRVRNRRVEVFVLYRGATTVSPPNCRFGRSERSNWLPPVPAGRREVLP